MDVKFCVPTLDEMEMVSEQIMNSYTSAYEGIMDKEYLSSLEANHWIPILHESVHKGDTCLVVEYGGKIIGSANSLNYNFQLGKLSC